MLFARHRLLLVIGLGAAIALSGLTWATADGLAAVQAGKGAAFEDLLGLAALGGAWLAVLWLCLGFTAAMLAALSGGIFDRIATTITPSLIRRLARLAVGATVVTCGVAVPPGAALAHTTPPVLPDLDRPVPAADPPADRKRPEEVVVEPGDTLWDISAARLRPDPSNAEIAVEWPRWYAQNRAVIGDDPNLIFPGQRLQPPGAPAE